MQSSTDPLKGFFATPNLKGIYYGPTAVQDHLISCLPSAEKSKAFIVTGSSLANKTPCIKQIEQLLGPNRHAGTFSDIKQHAPIAQLDAATEQVSQDSSIDTIISVGGGSPIDSSKAIVHRVREKLNGKLLRHISIPTTLSAAESGFTAGFTKEDGVKTGIADPVLFVSYIIYDASFGKHTPPRLFLSTGIRALDHAVEMQYHPFATEMPTKLIARGTIQELFENLPKYKSDPSDEQTILKLFLAAYAGMGFLGNNTAGGLGLSHSMGYALGSPYGIPHGITSCLTLGHVVKLKARLHPGTTAGSIARILPYLGQQRSGDDVKDAEVVGDRILDLVQRLGLKTNLTELGVSKDQVDIIVQRASGGLKPGKELTEEQEKQRGGIKELTESLW